MDQQVLKAYSSIGPGARERKVTPTGTHEFLPEQFARDDVIGHLVFAIKYDGIDLGVLRSVFEALGGAELTRALRESPSSTYLRRLWFFYEWLIGTRLELADVSAGAYVDALEPDEYVTHGATPARWA